MISKETEQKAIEMYRSGLGLQKICRIIGIAKKSVMNILVRNNIPRRLPIRIMTDADKLKISTKIRNKFMDESYKETVVSKLLCNHDSMTKEQKSAAARKGWTEDRKIRHSEINKKLWKDGILVGHKLDGESRAKIGRSIKLKWKQDGYKEKQSAGHSMAVSLIDYKLLHRKLAYERFADESYAKKHKIACKEKWNDLEYKEKCAIARSKNPKVSNIQNILYSILDDLKVRFFREYKDKPADPETIIGPWSFDCVIPRNGQKTLLVECQGDYWHKNVGPKDDAKASYIANNFSDKYELKCLWEHEFGNHNRIVETIKYWLGLTKLEVSNFKFDDVEIKDCQASEYKLLLSKYHYLSNAGRGGIAYGAYLSNELVAVCIFSPLVRQNIGNNDTTRELSRLCIHPRYQKKNFASWFVTKCMSRLPKHYNQIISYCDTTFNHNGATYKACNFKLDSKIPPDYWYRSKDGWVMHKKTLYNHAVKMGITEVQFAADNEYEKVYGLEKLRFVFKRR